MSGLPPRPGSEQFTEAELRQILTEVIVAIRSGGCTPPPGWRDGVEAEIRPLVDDAIAARRRWFEEEAGRGEYPGS